MMRLIIGIQTINLPVITTNSQEMKAPDKRCCGSGVCIINAAGECWCGQVWDGEKMTAPSLNLQSAGDKNQEQVSDKLAPDSKNYSS